MALPNARATPSCSSIYIPTRDFLLSNWIPSRASPLPIRSARDISRLKDQSVQKSIDSGPPEPLVAPISPKWAACGMYEPSRRRSPIVPNGVSGRPTQYLPLTQARRTYAGLVIGKGRTDGLPANHGNNPACFEFRPSFPIVRPVGTLLLRRRARRGSLDVSTVSALQAPDIVGRG
jgi:hypothetical protein